MRRDTLGTSSSADSGDSTAELTSYNADYETFPCIFCHRCHPPPERLIMNALAQWYYSVYNVFFLSLKYLNGLAPLALRLYLVPVFWIAGTQQIAGVESTIQWIGNPEWGLGLPYPSLIVHIAMYTDAIRVVRLRYGLGTPWSC